MFGVCLIVAIAAPPAAASLPFGDDTFMCRRGKDRRALSKREVLRELKRAAHHEAGHAVIAYAYGFRPYLATIAATTDEFEGQVRIEISTFAMLYPPALAKRLVYILAGIAAQDRYSRSSHAFLCGAGDLEQFKNEWCKLHILTEGKCGRDYEFEQMARRAVNQFWYAIRDFASVLLERNTLEGDELDQTLSEVIYPEGYKCPPTISGVCPFDTSVSFYPPNLSHLEAQSTALRLAMKAERRSLKSQAR
jgi:hypothetical protein